MENQEKDVNTQPKEAPKYDPEELAIIFDDIIFQGYYEEDMKVKGKLQATFRSRTADLTSQISRKLDSSSFNLGSTYIEQRALWNLASSLVSISGKNLSQLSLDERFNEISKLNAQLVSLLSKILVDFDAKIDAACKEGEENF